MVAYLLPHSNETSYLTTSHHTSPPWKTLRWWAFVVWTSGFIFKKKTVAVVGRISLPNQLASNKTLPVWRD